MKKFDLKFIKKFIKNHNHIICQKYLPKIIHGDKRVFLINGKIVGAISRVPKKGSFLSNMSKGAIAVKTKLTNKELKISRIINVIRKCSKLHHFHGKLEKLISRLLHEALDWNSLIPLIGIH